MWERMFSEFMLRRGPFGEARLDAAASLRANGEAVSLGCTALYVCCRPMSAGEGKWAAQR